MSEPHWLTGEVIDESTPPWIFGMNKSYFLLGLKTIGWFLILFIIITINLLAASIALQCNRGTGPQKLKAALFAFFFGPIYIVINYLFKRVLAKGEKCDFSQENPFPIV
jgi:hypothetical protein